MKWVDIKTKSDLKKVKAIVNKKKHSEASDHYKMIHTDRVIEIASDFGWYPVQAAAVGNNPYGKHMVKLENPNVILSEGDKVQMVISNSHDRTKQFKFDAGVYRLVCSNGLVIPIQSFIDMTQRHMSFDRKTLYKQIRENINNLNKVGDTVERMREFDLSADQAESIAFDALLSRLGEEELVKTVDLDMFLAPRRRSDMGHDLWRTFNVVQERIIGGYFTYTTTNKDGESVERKGREINNFLEDARLNKEMFSNALEVMS